MLEVAGKQEIDGLRPLIPEGERILYARRPHPFAYATGSRGGWLLLIGAATVSIGLGILIKFLTGGPFIEEYGGYRGDAYHYGVSIVVMLLGGIFLFAFLLRLREGLTVRFVVTDRRISIVKGSNHTARAIYYWGGSPLSIVSVKRKGKWPPTIFLGQGVEGRGRWLAWWPALYGIRDADAVAALIGQQRYAPGKSATWLDVSQGPYPSVIPPMPPQAVPVELQKYLEEGEDVFWVGHPSPRRYGWRYVHVNWGGLGCLVFFYVPFMFLLVGAILGNLFSGTGGVGSFVGTVILVVLWVLPFTFTYRAAKRRADRAPSIIYAVTRRRALMIFPFETFAEKRALEYGPATVSVIRVVKRGEYGDIFFESVRPTAAEIRSLDPGFLGIKDPAKVAAIINEQAWSVDMQWK